MKLKSKLIFLFIFPCFILTAQSDFFKQKRFNAGFIFGVNSSGLVDEGLDSYQGWNVGGFGIADLGKDFHLSMELLFSQNGNYLSPKTYPNVEYSKIQINFVEIPLQINYQLLQNNGKSDRTGWLRTGVAYAHLLNFTAKTDTEDVSSQIIWKDKNAILVNFGGTFFLNKNWGIDVRMSFPIQGEELMPTLTFRGVYLL